MDARNTGPDWPRRPTTQNVVMGVLPWLQGSQMVLGCQGESNQTSEHQGQRFHPLPGSRPLGAPQLNDVIEEGSLDLQCVCVCVV